MLPKGFHRIRHYGLFANGNRAANVARSRELLAAMPRLVEQQVERTGHLTDRLDGDACVERRRVELLVSEQNLDHP